MKAKNALERLKNGNKRYIDALNSGGYTPRTVTRELLKELQTKGQQGSVQAIVITCSDSRVAPEFIFDAVPGDIYVIRTAGNACLCEENLAALEFGVFYLHEPLVVVMGHTDCGAVNASFTCQGITEDEQPHVLKLTERLRRTLDINGYEKPTGDIADKAARKNVFETIKRIRENCGGVAKAEQEKKILIAPAFYCLEKGEVEWLDDEANS